MRGSVQFLKQINRSLRNTFVPFQFSPHQQNVFEKLVELQMTTFCESESVLRDTISSFRKGHSTNTVLMGMCDDLLRAMKKGEVRLLYIHIRNCSDFKVYCREVNAYLLNTICKQFVNCIQGCITITNLCYILIQYLFTVQYYYFSYCRFQLFFFVVYCSSSFFLYCSF